MPGLYDDVIICKLRSQPDNVQTEHVLPLKMYVRGCPFVIVETSLGMSYGPKSADEKYQIIDEGKDKDGMKEKEYSGGDERKNNGIDEIGADVNYDNDNDNDSNNDSNNNNGDIKNENDSTNNKIDDTKNSLRGSKNSRGRPLLLMGHVCTNAPRPTRALQIKNQGSKIGIITWTCTAAFPDRKKDR